MIYTHDLERAGSTAGTVLEKMDELGIPANPMNYTIWYTYFCQSHPDLTSAVDEMLSKGEAFSADRNEAMYGQFFGFDEEGEEIRKTGNEIQLKVDDVVGQVNQASLDNSDFGFKLGGIMEGLEVDAGPEVVESVIRDVLTETRDIIAKGKTMEQKLAASSKEIDSLREHLKAVRLEAMTDGLTGIANRKCFDKRLGDEAINAMEEASELCLLMIDIDHFKQFNDTYGHRIGDSVLKVVARNLGDGIKGRDLAARYGGEEFAVILPETELANAAKLADGIRAKLANKELKNTKTNETYGRVTISVGVALFHPDESLSEFVQRADEALYAAKDDGRNRVFTEEQLPAKLSMAG